MPTYEYRPAKTGQGCDHCRNGFEVVQSMSADALTACPECGGPVQRVISLVAISTRQSTRSMLSDKNLKSKGFTKLVNEGGGKFRNVTAD